jgi:hypothetical protein
MWEPRRLRTLWAAMACYRDSFTFLLGRLHCFCLQNSESQHIRWYTARTIGYQVSHIKQQFTFRPQAGSTSARKNNFLPSSKKKHLLFMPINDNVMMLMLFILRKNYNKNASRGWNLEMINIKVLNAEPMVSLRMNRDVLQGGSQSSEELLKM